METNYVSDEIITAFLNRRTTTKEELFKDKYIIVINGRIFFDCRGICMFDSRDRAIKAFYESSNWTIKRDIYQSEHTNVTNSWSSGDNQDRRTNWNRFKKTLKDKYSFDIIQL